MCTKITYHTLLRRLILATLLTICHLGCYALTDDIKYEILTRASDLIDDKENNATVLQHKIDSVIELELLPDSDFISFVVDDVGEYFRQQGRQSAAVELFSMLAGSLEQEKSLSTTLLRLYIPLGAALEEVGMWNSAMEYYHKALAIAEEQEQKAKAQEARAKVILAEAEIPLAIAEAFREGNLGIMDYYKLQNIQADTHMREGIIKSDKK